ncbi:hypothetical protein BCV70DRAFT_197440 [Testicularia cyperi]|uniref:Uncharacterized protein n=1 Tax=Testicularia cyperi TaxID=1882483 RepID=A0A317XZ37_9BASI|nr:hypothetical protein BCV70DRAFT_197440 [Testicularia cyperi]
MKSLSVIVAVVVRALPRSNDYADVNYRALEGLALAVDFRSDRSEKLCLAEHPIARRPKELACRESSRAGEKLQRAGVVLSQDES